MAYNPENYRKENITFSLGPQLGSVTIGPDTAMQVLEQNKDTILDIIIQYFLTKDPTQNKEYTLWLLKLWTENPRQFGARMEDINRNNFLAIHQRGRQAKKIGPPDSDIKTFSTYEQFEETMERKYPELFLSSAGDDRGTYKVIWDNTGRFRIINPQNQQAACYYGQGTRWCTAATRGTNYFDSYNNEGPLYVLIPYKPAYPGEKYQLWFGDADDPDPNQYQIMNEQDKPVNIFKFFNDKFPELKTFDLFMPYIDNLILLANTKTTDGILDIIKGVITDLADELVEEIRMGVPQYAEAIREIARQYQGGSKYRQAMRKLPFHKWAAQHEEETGESIEDVGDQVYGAVETWLSSLEASELKFILREKSTDDQFKTLEQLPEIMVDTEEHFLDRDELSNEAWDALSSIAIFLKNRVKVYRGDDKPRSSAKVVGTADGWKVAVTER